MSTRGWSLTLGLGFGTAWLVVYEAPSTGKPLNAVLGPVLLAGLAGCLFWFFLDPRLKSLYRKARRIQHPQVSVGGHPDDPRAKTLTLSGLSGAAVVVCEVQDSEHREYRGSQNLLYGEFPIATEVALAFPQSFSGAKGDAGRYTYRWLVETHAERGTFREVASGRFKLGRRPSALTDPVPGSDG